MQIDSVEADSIPDATVRADTVEPEAVEAEAVEAESSPAERAPVSLPTATELIAGAAPIEVTDKEALLRRIFGEHGRRSGEARVLRQLLDENVAGVAVFAGGGERLFANEPYMRLDLPSGTELREACSNSDTGLVHIQQDLVSSVSVKLVEIDGGFSIITDPATDRLGIREKAFGSLVDPALADEDIYRRAALALGRASGWRWIGVSRFRGSDTSNGSDGDDGEAVDGVAGTVDFVGWWDAAELKPEFEAILEGTADEVVVATEEFCYYDGQHDLRRRFPDWDAVGDYPVKSYAGLTYNVDGTAAGHIVAMHDEAGTSREVIEDLLRLFSQFIGVHLELEQQRDRTNAARSAAMIDALTGLGNRAAFDEHLPAVAKAFRAGAVEDALLVIADLDNLERVNDEYDNKAGDRYLKSYAEVIRKMWRPTDHFFRIGPGRYAMVISGITPGQVKLVKKRLMDGAEDLRKAVYFDKVATDVSYGTAFASAHDGDMAAATEAAGAMLDDMRKSQRAKQIAREQLGRRRG